MRLTTRNKLLASLFLLATLPSANMASAQANIEEVPSVIDRFVAALFPTATQHFWIINDTKSDADREMIVDINTIVTNSVGGPPTQNRFLLLLVNGQVLGAQNVPLDATVECGDEEV